jgi:hypothetical protein
LELRHARRHRRDRLREIEEVEQEGDQVGHGEVARRDAGAAHPQHGEERHLDHQARGCADYGLVLGAVHSSPVRLLGGVRDGAGLARFRPARLDRPQGAERALERRPQRADSLLLALGGAHDPREDDGHRGADHDEHAERDREQYEIHHAHEDDRAQQRDHAGQQLHQRGRRHAAEERGVRRGPRHQVAGRLAVQGAEPQAQQARRKIAPHPKNHALGGALEQPELDCDDGGAEQHQAAEHQQRGQQRAVIGQCLDHLARRERLRQSPGRAEQRQHRGDHERPAMGTHSGKQSRPG